LKISDFISAREYHRRAVYRDFYRHIGAEDQISFAVQISPGFMIGIAFNRAVRSFTEKDRTCLNLVRPHIVQVYLRLAEIAGHKERQHDLHAVLRESGMGLITLSRAGVVIHSTPGAFECLARYLPVPQSGAARLPSRLTEWLRQAEGLGPAEPLVVGHDLVRLIVRHVPSEDRRLLLLSEENTSACLQRLDRFALTARECEVLQWLAQGKANAEIATILGVTHGTVKLHVERILTKLNVDNRVLAAMVFHGVNV
jgi:DNA-binding CsgD family transcriptional regulator